MRSKLYGMLQELAELKTERAALIDRTSGEARSFHVDDANAANIVPIVRKNVAKESTIATDERVREAEAEVARLKAWEREKDRYRLVRWEYGAFAYILKDAEAGGEPPHALCATCYQRGIKSLLQFNGEMQIFKQAWDCPSCKFSLRAGRDALSEVV